MLYSVLTPQVLTVQEWTAQLAGLVDFGSVW